jgi:hypothetical protein
MKEKAINLENKVGKKVKLKGYIAEGIRQHMFKFIETHPQENYIDLSKSNLQIIVYTKDQINCDNEIEFTGNLIKIYGSKNPRSKVDESYFEYQLIADSWKCLKK